MLVFLVAVCLALALALATTRIFQPPWLLIPWPFPLYISPDVATYGGLAILIMATGYVVRTISLNHRYKLEENENIEENTTPQKQGAETPADHSALINEIRAYRKSQKTESRKRDAGETVTLMLLLIAGIVASLQGSLSTRLTIP
jgi:hypothetical protein